MFLPPYSPDLNPIEESFSAVKAWLRRHWKRALREDPELILCEAAATVTRSKSTGWFTHAGYSES